MPQLAKEPISVNIQINSSFLPLRLIVILRPRLHHHRREVQ